MGRGSGCRPGEGRGRVGLAPAGWTAPFAAGARQLAPGEGFRPARAGARRLAPGALGHFGGDPGRLWPPPKWPSHGEKAEGPGERWGSPEVSGVSPRVRDGDVTEMPETSQNG